jgi:hypothetical protein
MELSAIGLSLLVHCLSSSQPIELLQAIFPLNTTPVFSPSTWDT